MFTFNYNIPAEAPVSNMDLEFCYFGTEACEDAHSRGPALNDHYKLHYIHKGHGIFRTGQSTYHVNEGDCFLICPNTLAYYRSDEETPWAYYCVAFNGMNAQTYLSRANLSKDTPTIRCNRRDSVLQCFKDMFEATHTKRSGDIRLLSALYSLMAIIIDATSLENQNNNARAMSSRLHIKKAIEFIQANYSRNMSISEIAEYTNFNRKYFAKLFKTSMGISPQQYLINFRLNKACELLKNPILSIGDISRSVGYDDQLQFSKIFKKFKGISPNKYRGS